VKPANTPFCLLPKKTWRGSLPIDMFLSAVFVFIAALPSSEIPEGLMNYPVLKTVVYMRFVYTHNTFGFKEKATLFSSLKAANGNEASEFFKFTRNIVSLFC
jgi:hypothetical protein